MSNFKRDSGIANSALIVAVTPADFPTAGPLGGIAFQRTLEERAFALGGGKIPVQLYGDSAANRPTVALGDVKPVFCGGYSFANLRELMPEALNGAFLEGMEQFGRRIRGFDRADAVLAGIESRTSSPLRICRDESLQSSLKGFIHAARSRVRRRDHIGGHGRPEGCGRDHQAVCSGRLNCKSGSAPEKRRYCLIPLERDFHMTENY